MEIIVIFLQKNLVVLKKSTIFAGIFVVRTCTWVYGYS